MASSRFVCCGGGICGSRSADRQVWRRKTFLVEISHVEDAIARHHVKVVSTFPPFN
ncbi:MAG: hypothetical protein HC772_19645 [Leptolyngbyaceae cyanobacterium CRU_2_3]|nr:hypothetical protein [Leptolyngbyaceae cyanobacterium CRU_2_3]